MEISIDITERKETDRLKDEMISAISREVYTPLAAMIGYSELMMDTDVLPEQRKEYLGIICTENERLAELFDNLLCLQTLKAGKYSPEGGLISIAAYRSDMLCHYSGDR